MTFTLSPSRLIDSGRIIAMHSKVQDLVIRISGMQSSNLMCNEFFYQYAQFPDSASPVNSRRSLSATTL